MKDSFFKAITEYDMLRPGDKVVVGVSGGADSMCLLDLLNEHKNELGITVQAAHVNHCLRGAESDADERFVRNYCEKNGIALSVLRADIPVLAAERGESTELCARNVRYDFFGSLNPDKIATAHTASDAVETMLMNLSRGASLGGLCSIPAVRGKVIRPLIYFMRADTEAYCRQRGIGFVVDSSNLTDEYTRNKFRHNVVGPLKEINPAFESNAARCLEALRCDNDFLGAYSRRILSELLVGDGVLNAGGLADMHKAVRRRVIALFLDEYGDSDYEKIHIELIDRHLNASNYSQVLPGNVRLSVVRGKMFFEKKIPVRSISPFEFSKYESKTVEIGDMCIRIYPCDKRTLAENEIAVDFYRINDIITFRPRKEGDALSLASRRCRKSLKKLFNEMKIPAEMRSSVPVLGDENGVIWCAAGGVDAGRLPDKNTIKYLIIKTEGCKNDQ